MALFAVLAGGFSTAISDAGGGTTDSPGANINKSKYCIIGAGPAGVQLGHLMHRAGLDYVVFERGYQAGTFFSKYPIHRRLNSFNRRHTRSTHGEFRLRHDWHTLLEHDDIPRFPNWTSQFWPEASTYVEYLNAFATEQVEAGRVRYCHNVASVAATEPGPAESNGTRYQLQVSVLSPCTNATAFDGITNTQAPPAGPVPEGGRVHELTHYCSVLVMADGMWKPTEPEKTHGTQPWPWVAGLDLAIGYDELATIPAHKFERKRVMILGCGNAAFETADALRDHVADIAMVCRGNRKVLQETRYVGDIRGPRGLIFDLTQLKSLETVAEMPGPLAGERHDGGVSVFGSTDESSGKVGEGRRALSQHNVAAGRDGFSEATYSSDGAALKSELENGEMYRVIHTTSAQIEVGTDEGPSARPQVPDRVGGLEHQPLGRSKSRNELDAVLDDILRMPNLEQGTNGDPSRLSVGRAGNAADLPKQATKFEIPQPTFALVPCGNEAMFSGWPDNTIDEPATGFMDKPALCLFERDPTTGLVMLGWADRRYPQVDKAIRLFPKIQLQDAPRWLLELYEGLGSRVEEDRWLSDGPGSIEQYKVMMIEYSELREPLSTDKLDVLAQCTSLWKGLHRRSYELDKSFDVVIKSLGWVYDDTVFRASGLDLELQGLGGPSTPGRQRPRVYPRLSPTHASTSLPHTYFVGANSHGLDRDRYKASGGFIHGFRYTTRAVFRNLISIYERGTPRPGLLSFEWPRPPPPGRVVPSCFADLLGTPLWKKLLERIIFSAASYEMVGGALVDGIVFDRPSKAAIYVEEIPEDLLHQIASPVSSAITFSFHAGGATEMRWGSGLFKAIRLSGEAPTGHPFHPVIEYWPAGAWSTYQGARARTTVTVDPDIHPSAIFHTFRGSSRVHLKADRNTDYTHFSQVPLLDKFFRDIETTVYHDLPKLQNVYHEALDI